MFSEKAKYDFSFLNWHQTCQYLSTEMPMSYPFIVDLTSLFSIFTEKQFEDCIRFFFCSEFEWEESEGLWSIHLANFLSGPTQQPCITWTHWLAKQDMREGGRKSTRKRERERERKGEERLREWEWHISIMRERKKISANFGLRLSNMFSHK